MEIHRAISMFMQTQSRGIESSTDIIAQKMEAEHITIMLQTADKDSERLYKAKKHDQIIKIIIFIVSIVFALFLLVFFKDSPYFITILGRV